MSVNKYQPHLLVLPEDGANSQIANGFILNSNVNEHVIQVLPIAGGWTDVVKIFKENHVSKMREFSERMMVLLMDFDKQERFTHVESQIPKDLKDRVFILGVLSRPEDLKRSIGINFESIGETLAQDCSDNTSEL